MRKNNQFSPSPIKRYNQKQAYNSGSSADENKENFGSGGFTQKGRR